MEPDDNMGPKVMVIAVASEERSALMRALDQAGFKRRQTAVHGDAAAMLLAGDEPAEIAIIDLRDRDAVLTAVARLRGARQTQISIFALLTSAETSGLSRQLEEADVTVVCRDEGPAALIAELPDPGGVAVD